MRFLTLTCVLCLSLTGCSTLPRYENPITGGVTPADITDALECELAEALPRWRKAKVDGVVRGPMVAVAELTLQVDEQATVAPSFTHTGVATAAFTQLFNWGAKLDRSANRTYTETVVFALDPDKSYDVRPDTRQGQNGMRRHAITSSLGLAEVIDRGVSSSTTHGKVAGVGSTQDPFKGKASFGQSANFVVSMNLNGLGPTWTMQNFKGPGSMLLAQRQDTHKVVISFADIDLSKRPDPSPSERYLKALCGKLAGPEACQGSADESMTDNTPKKGKKAGSRFTAMSREIRSRASGSAAGSRAFDDAVNRARENNTILRLQNLGTLVGP